MTFSGFLGRQTTWYIDIHAGKTLINIDTNKVTLIKEIYLARHGDVHALNPRRQMQEDLCEFEASLNYIAGSRTGRTATQRNPVSRPGSPFF